MKLRLLGWTFPASSANVNNAGLKYWSDDVYSDHPSHSYAYYAGIYGLLQICAMISLLLLGIALDIVSVKRAGANLHQNALRTLIQAPLGFFTKTDTGIVTNLFSQDLNLVDTELPNALLNTLFCVSQTHLHIHEKPAATSSLATSFGRPALVEKDHKIYRNIILRYPDRVLTGLPSNRTGSSHAYLFWVLRNKLPIPCYLVIYRTEILFENL